jgi:hypothetical protein
MESIFMTNDSDGNILSKFLGSLTDFVMIIVVKGTNKSTANGTKYAHQIFFKRNYDLDL